MEALILAIIIAYAIKKAVEDGKSHWQKSKSANRASTKGKSIPRRAASAVQHDTGYWAQQILSGFPRIRHGFANGWHAGRTAQAESHAAREKAKADHLEKRAGLIPELREHRRRQDEALERIRAAEQPEPESDAEQVLAAAAKGDRFVPGHESDPQGWYRKAARAVIPDAVLARLPGRVQGALCGCAICRGETSPFGASQSAPIAEGKPDAASADEQPGPGPSYSWGLADARLHWPSASRGEAENWARHMSTDGRPRAVAEYPPEGGPGKTVATYRNGELVPPEAGKGTSEGASPEASPSTPTMEEGTDMASEVTYDTVLRLAIMAQEFEEAALAERSGRAKQAAATSDQMQALGVDPATLGAMADYLDAMDEAEKAQQRAMEAAQAVADNLQRGHAGLSEAHKDAPVRAADREFYEEG